MSIVKWILFFTLLPFIYFGLLVYITLPVLLIVALIAFISIFFREDTILLGAIVLVSYALTFAPLIIYVYGEAFGFFKFIDKLKLNFWIKLLIIFLISIILFLIMFYSEQLFSGIKFNFDESRKLSFSAFFLIHAFFIHKFLKYYTCKPTRFHDLDYYFSIECYKKLFKKIKNKLIK